MYLYIVTHMSHTCAHVCPNKGMEISEQVAGVGSLLGP